MQNVTVSIVVKTPVDSQIVWAPTVPQGISVGFLNSKDQAGVIF